MTPNPAAAFRILIVEDNPDAARLLNMQLRAARHQVVGIAGNGEEALRWAESSRPDLVIMDIVLPGRLDGIETAAILAERHDIPVLFLTAYSDEEFYERARATSPLAYLSKPYDERELTRAIAVALDRHALLSRIKDSEAHLAEAQAVAGMGSWLWLLAEDRVELSDQLIQMLELVPGQFEPCFDTFLQLACEADRAAILRAVESLLRGEQAGEVDVRLCRTDDPGRVFRLLAHPRVDAEGRVVALIGTARDITAEWRAKQEAEAYREELEERVALRTAELSAANARLEGEIADRAKLEASLTASEWRYRSLVENLPEPMLVMQDEQVVYSNPALARLIGVAEVRGMSIDTLIHPGSRQVCETCKQATLSGRTACAPTVLRLQRADGGSVEVEALTYAFDYEHRPAILAVMRDLTVRRAMEQEAERFRVALDSSPDAVCLIDPRAMRFIDVNASACVSLGYSREQLLQLGPHDITPLLNRDMLRQQFEAVLVGGADAETLTTVHQRQDGTTFPVEIRLRAFDSAGQQLIVTVTRDISTQLKNEAELRETEARFRQLAESIDEAFWIRDLKGNRFLYANPAYERLYGKSVNSLYRHARSFLSSVHPEDRDRIAEAFDQQPFHPASLELEYRVVVAGRVRWLWVRTFPIRDADGKFYRSIGLAKDMTERRESEEQYRTIIQASMDGFWVIDSQGRLVDCNEAACQISGYAREELLTLSVLDLEARETAQQTAEHMRGIIERGFDRFESRHRCKDGHVIDVDISAYFQATPEGGLFVAFLRDVSEQKRAETALKLLSERLALAVRAAQVGIWEWNLINDDLIWDDAMYRIYGVSREQFSGAYPAWEAGLHPDDLHRMREVIQMALSGERECDTEFRVVWPDQSIRHIKVNAVVLRDEAGKPMRMIGTNWDITERKQMEVALRLERDTKQRYLDTAQTLLVALDNQGRVTMVNRKACEVLGYREDELLGRNWLETCLPQSMHEVIVPVMEQIVAGNLQPVEYLENPILCRDGSQRLIAWHNSHLTDAQGQIVGILGSGEDITERRRSEQALIESEERYRAVVEDQTELICRLLADGTLTFVNAVFCRFFGKREDELIGSTWHPCAHPDDVAMIEAKLATLSPSNPQVLIENRVTSGQGEERWMQFVNRAFFDASGHLTEIQAVARDITDRKHAELALRQSEARSRSILRAAPIGIGVLVARVFQEVNEGMTRMTGYAAEELVDRPVHLLYPTQEEFDYVGVEMYRQLRAHGIGVVETRWRRKDGAIIDVALSSAPIDVEDLSHGVTFTAKDITVEKHAEQERLLHEAAQRDALVREVHHRIKNNLQGVIGLLRQHMAQHPDTQEVLEAAMAQINTIAVVHGLQGRMPQSELRLRELLREVIAAVASLALLPKPPRLEDTLRSDIWLEGGAVVSVALILNELIHNAIKHGSDADSIAVHLAGDPGQATLRIVNPGGPLPAGFDLATGRGCGTGLDLVRTLLPRRGATLSLREHDARIETELVLSPPMIKSPVPPSEPMSLP